MNKKAEIGIQSIFYILMIVFMVGIVVFGFSKLFEVQDILSSQEKLDIINSIQDSIEYCEDPLNRGNKRVMKIDASNFDLVCVFGDDFYSTHASTLPDVVSIYEAGDNGVIFKLDYVDRGDTFSNDEILFYEDFLNGVPASFTNRYVVPSYNIIDSFESESKFEETNCLYDFDSDGLRTYRIICDGNNPWPLTDGSTIDPDDAPLPAEPDDPSGDPEDGDDPLPTEPDEPEEPIDEVELCEDISADLEFRPDIAIDSGFTYPHVVRTLDRTGLNWGGINYLMFVGGFAQNVNDQDYSSTPSGDSSHLVYPKGQEEIWFTTSTGDLGAWDPNILYAFGIKPDTFVQSLGQTYSQAYPEAFDTHECFSKNVNDLVSEYQGKRCNVQINDPSVIIMGSPGNEIYHMYFTIFENYRWYSGKYGDYAKQGENVENPTEMNKHSVGLATSTDGLTWDFIGKVIPEDPSIKAELSSGVVEDVLGAWAPSAIRVGNNVDIYFHDAFGNKQYVARLSGGRTLSSIKRLNSNDLNYRANLDVVQKDDDKYDVFYNVPGTHPDPFDIAKTSFTSPDDFGIACTQEDIDSSVITTPTPHAFIDDSGNYHLYYWDWANPSRIIYKVLPK